MAATLHDRTERAGAKAAKSDGVRRVARLGFVARAVLYLLVGVLALRVAYGQRNGTSKSLDRQGALRTLAAQPFGKVLLAAVALGFAGYAVWRFVEAVVDPDQAGLGHRAVAFARGLLYAAFCWSAASFLFQPQKPGTSNSQNEDWTGRVLRWPMGKWLVGAVGVGLVAGGVWSVYRGVARKYEKSLKMQEMSPRTRRLVRVVALVGHVARGVVFAAVGYFVVHAAIDYNPKEAVGLDGALRRLATGPSGHLVLTLVALGLMSFGLFSFVEARYRKVLDS